ncbi:MAG: hypothetical protein MR912_08745, partial [Prevotella sp.]|nr:hypothetical protein [Prevotella sp.]
KIILITYLDCSWWYICLWLFKYTISSAVFFFFFTIIYNLSLEMSDEPKKMGTTNCTPYMTTEKNCWFSLKLSHRFSVKEAGLPQK